MGFGTRIWDLGLGFGIWIKLTYGLKIVFELEAYLIGSGDAGLVRKDSQLNLTLSLDILI